MTDLKKASSVIHNDVRKIVDLLVKAVHLVDSSANRKKFLLIKGEKGMDKEKIKANLKEQGLGEDEIDIILKNDKLCAALENTEDKAIDVFRNGIREKVMEMENALEEDNISSITEKLTTSFTGVLDFFPQNEEENNEDDKKDDDDKSDDSDDKKTDDDTIDDSVSELIEEVSGLVEDVAGLAQDMLSDANVEE